MLTSSFAPQRRCLVGCITCSQDHARCRGGFANRRQEKCDDSRAGVLACREQGRHTCQPLPTHCLRMLPHINCSVHLIRGVNSWWSCQTSIMSGLSRIARGRAWQTQRGAVQGEVPDTLHCTRQAVCVHSHSSRADCIQGSSFEASSRENGGLPGPFILPMFRDLEKDCYSTGQSSTYCHIVADQSQRRRQCQLVGVAMTSAGRTSVR